MTEDAEEVEFGETLVRLEGVSKHFSQGSGFIEGIWPKPPVRANDDVTLEIKKGETLGLVGESGCGKSTLARTILQLLEATEGDIFFKGRNLAELSGKELREQREDMQMILPAAHDTSEMTPRRQNSATASRAHRNWPVRLTSSTCCHCPRVMRWKGASRWMPALATRISRLPQASMTVRNMDRTSSSRLTSPRMARASPPSAWISFTSRSAASASAT